MFENDLKKGIDAMTQELPNNVDEKTQQNKWDSKPYKTIGDLEHYIKPFDDVDKQMLGNPKANFTIFSKKKGQDWDIGSGSGLDFETEDQAKKMIDDWETIHVQKSNNQPIQKSNNQSKYKTADEVANAWQQLFKEWDEKYPDNNSWNSIKANKVWEEEGWKKRSDDLEKEFDRLATKEWNKEHPDMYFNRETQKYEKVDPESREWNEELGEYQPKEESLETRNARMTLYSQKLDDALKERDRILKADNVPNKADQLNDINDVIDFYKRKLANKE